MFHNTRRMSVLLTAAVLALCVANTTTAQRDPTRGYGIGIACASSHDARAYAAAREVGLLSGDLFPAFIDTGRCFPAAWRSEDFDAEPPCPGATMVSGYAFPNTMERVLEVLLALRKGLAERTLPEPAPIYLPAEKCNQ